MKSGKTLNLYYDYSKAFSYNKHQIVIIGDRGHGKSYGIKDIGLKYGIKNHVLGLIWVRRYFEDLKRLMKKFLTDWLPNNPKISEEYSIFVEGMFVYCMNLKTLDKWVVCEFIALSGYEKEKSVPRPNAKYLVYDEFITKGQYLKDECFAIADLKESIFRDRVEWYVIYLSNALTTQNPILDGLGINPKDFTHEFTSRDTFVLHYDSYDVEWKKHKKEVSPPMFKNYDYESYSIDSNFVLDNLNGVEEPPTNAIKKFQYNLKLETILIGVWNINGLTYFGDAIVNQATRTYSPMSNDCFANNYIYIDYKNLYWKHRMDDYVNGRLRFKSLKIKNALLETFNLIKSHF